MEGQEEIKKEELKKHIDQFFENPINRLIFARLGEIDGEKIDWDWVKHGDKKKK